MNRIVILPYKMASKSSKDLAESLRARGQRVLRVYPDRNYRPKESDFVINWGSSTESRWRADMLNEFHAVSGSSDKVSTLLVLKDGDVSVPEFTTSPDVAKTWDGKILARTLTHSSGGKGIVVCTSDTLVHAPLYTKYIEKDAEYRVHIFKGECIDYVKKVQHKEDATDAENMIGNHENGWYFMREIKRLDDNIELAKKAIEALGLDFGAVDIIRKDKISYVLEVNSAPGISGISLEAYTDAIINYVNR